MPATCGSTALLKELRERQEDQKAKEQVPMKMRSKTQPAKAKILAETDTMTKEAEASEKANGALKQASKSCGKRKSKHQAAHAEAQAVPRRGLQNATQTLTPALAEPRSDQASAPPHKKTAVSSHPQQQKSREPASPLTLLSMPPQQESIHPAPAVNKTAVASDRQQCSAAPQSNTIAHAIPASTAAAAEVPGATASSAQQVAPIPAASSASPQQPASASAAAPAGALEQEQANPRTAALQMMVNASIKKEEGALALAAVPENPEDAEGWAMTAIEWLTTQMELRDEIHDMDRAMQVSLQEAKQQKQAQRTPLEMPEEELLAHFKGSVLIPKLKECACGKAILNPPLKDPIVHLLELEQKACRWYSTAGTKAFFLRLGEQCKEAALQAGHPPEGASCKKQRVSSPADEQHSTGDKDVSANPAFCAFLSAKARELRHGLYQMPETSGEVPAIFMPADGAPEDHEVTPGEQAAEELVLYGDAIVLD